jgi:hypothetical protein
MSIEEHREIDGPIVNRGDTFRRPPTERDSGDVTETLAGRGSDERGERESATSRKSDAQGPFGGLTATQAQARSAQRRCEKKRQREKAAAYEALTVEGRAAMAMASTLTYPELCAALDALRQLAVGGSIQALRELRAWTELSTRLTGGDDNTAGVRWADMTPQQRAAARAQIEKRLAELALEADNDAADGMDAGADPLPPRG